MTNSTEQLKGSRRVSQAPAPGEGSRLQGVKLQASEWPIWDLLCNESIHSTVFASSRYLLALARNLDRKVSAYIIQRGGKPIAGTALLERRYLGASVAMPLPATPYSAVLYSKSTFASTYPAKNTSEHIAITRALIDSMQSEFSSIDLTLCPGIDDVRPWIWSGWSASPSYTYVLDVSEELKMSYSVQKNAQKAQRAGATTSLEWSPDQCWTLLESTYARQGVSIGLNQSEFLSLADELYRGGLAWMVTIHNPKGEPLASRIQLSVPGTDTVYDWVAGASPAGFPIGASPWNVMKIVDECRKRGYSRWNMCGANFEAIAKFKSEFGGDLVHGFSLHSPRPVTHSLVARARLRAGLLKRKLRRRKGR